MTTDAALDLSRCPYFLGDGKCESGCYDEPSCITDRPRGGWPGEPRCEHGVSLVDVEYECKPCYTRAGLTPDDDDN